MKANLSLLISGSNTERWTNLLAHPQRRGCFQCFWSYSRTLRVSPPNFPSDFRWNLNPSSVARQQAGRETRRSAGYLEVMPHIKTKWSCRMWMKWSKNRQFQVLCEWEYEWFSRVHAHILCTASHLVPHINEKVSSDKANDCFSLCFCPWHHVLDTQNVGMSCSKCLQARLQPN